LAETSVKSVNLFSVETDHAFRKATVRRLINFLSIGAYSGGADLSNAVTKLRIRQVQGVAANP